MLGRNEPLRPLRPAEFTDKTRKIGGFSISQCVRVGGFLECGLKEFRLWCQ
jgi:hypothetical protein